MSNIPEIKSIECSEFETSQKPEDFYRAFAGLPYSAFLYSAGGTDNSRYSFIGLNPFLVYSAKKNPFEEFQKLIDFYSVKNYAYPINLWGGIGYFSYSAGRFIEDLPETTVASYEMPVMQMIFYKDFIVFDNLKNKKYHIRASLKNDSSPKTENILKIASKRGKPGSFFAKGKIESCTRESYIKKVRKIIEYIKKGDAYEVNLSRQCSCSYEGDTYSLFRKLTQINPAPFSAYLPFGETTVISNSPERFLLADEDRIETRPIKGTSPRHQNKAKDGRSRQKLASSAKDDAELSMVVDLLRNDLGKVSKYGSVKVSEHKRIEGFSNVWQMLSIIQSRLRNNENYGSLLRACFPGGSITGCPKIRSMEIIDELEKYSRNIYTGSIFVANDSRFDSSIVIRTLVATGGKLYFNVGGAVIYDSVPEDEYEETEHKAKSIIEALQIKS